MNLPTTAAEYVALGDAVKKVRFFRQVWRSMLPRKGTPYFPVFEDNQSAVQLAQHPVTNSNSKNINVRHHFVLARPPGGYFSNTRSL